MSQIAPQSNIHRNPAHAPPAADEPTRNRTSEKSGMQKDQHDTQFKTALLRKENSDDTLETNRLCCSAAGIIAPSSSTSEALIPHQKLREAAISNATLIAQTRPPAQPAAGYKHLGNTESAPQVAINLKQIDEFVRLKKSRPVLESLRHCSQRDAHITNAGEWPSRLCDSNWESINTREAV